MDEEEKLIQRKKKLEAGSSKQALAECCEDLAKFYYKHKQYSKALEQYEEMASIYFELKQMLKWAKCNGWMGKTCLYLAKFDDGIMYTKKYLEVTQELKNVVEEQKALLELGNVYLLKAENILNELKARNALEDAESAFHKSLALCDQLSIGKKNIHIAIQIKRANLYLNLGLVYIYLDQLERGSESITTAIGICTDERLPEPLYKELHICYEKMSLFYNKKKDYKSALWYLDKALDAAANLIGQDAVLRTCETLQQRAEVLCKMSRYQDAKEVLLEAHKKRSPESSNRKAIAENLAVVEDMCNTAEELKRTDPSNHSALKDLYDKLGDWATKLQNYADAAKYYHKELEHAKLSGIKETDRAMSPIYVSLYQTYKDMARFDKDMSRFNDAIPYHWKEYELIKDDPKEAYETMSSLAETLFWAKKPYRQIKEACDLAIQAANSMKDDILFVKIMKRLATYQKYYNETGEMIKTLKTLGCDKFEDMEESDDEQSPSKSSFITTRIIGRDIHLETLSDGNDEASYNGQEAQNNGNTQKKTTNTVKYTHKKILNEVPTCDNLLLEAEGFYKKSDYQTAKRILIKAYKLKTPDKNKKAKIEKILRFVAEICKSQKSVETTDNPVILKDVYEKLGECAYYLKNHQDAAKYFLQQLQEAKKAGEAGKLLIPIYVSLYQSYKEMGEYEKALSYYEKEYELNKHDPKQAFNTMYYMADTLCLAKRPSEQIEQAYFKARRAAQQWGNIEAEKAVLKKMYEYHQQQREFVKSEAIKKELDKLGYKWDNSQEFDEQQNYVGDGEILYGEDICIEALTDYSDSEDDEETSNNSRRRSSQNGYKLKKNAKGETKLQQACIAGDVSLVRELLDAGHPVLVTDNAKWTPLHEAAVNGFTDIVAMLIQKGADLNDNKNVEHLTPLQDAARNGHLEVIELLLDSGAKRSLKTPSGEKAIDFLKQWREENHLKGDQEVLYKRIYDKLMQNRQSNDKKSNQDPKTPVKAITNYDQPSTSKNRIIFEEDISPTTTTELRHSSGDEFATPNTNRKRKINDTNKSSTNETSKIKRASHSQIKSPYFQKATARKSTAKGVSNSQSPAPLKPVRVKIEDTVILIPVRKDSIDNLTIKWLVDETKSRYHIMTRKHVEVSLTRDGAVILEGEPLSLVHKCNEFNTIITHSNTSNVNVLEENSDVIMKDASNNETAEPMPNTSRAEPQASTSRVDIINPTSGPEPIVSTPNSGTKDSTLTSKAIPIRVETQTSALRSELAPSTSMSKLTASASRSKPTPPTSRSKPQASASRSELTPTTSRGEPAASTSRAELTPSTSRAEPTASTSRAELTSSMSTSEPTPSMSGSELTPSMSRSEPSPSTSRSESQTSASRSETTSSTTGPTAPTASAELNNNLQDGNIGGRTIPRKFLEGLESVPEENLDKFWSQAVCLTILYS